MVMSIPKIPRLNSALQQVLIIIAAYIVTSAAEINHEAIYKKYGQPAV